MLVKLCRKQNTTKIFGCDNHNLSACVTEAYEV